MLVRLVLARVLANEVAMDFCVGCGSDFSLCRALCSLVANANNCMTLFLSFKVAICKNAEVECVNISHDTTLTTFQYKN